LQSQARRLTPWQRSRGSFCAGVRGAGREALKPILFDDHDKAEADAARTSIVAKAQRSEAARRKARTKRTDDGLPVHSFRSLLGDLTTVTHNTMAIAHQTDTTFVIYPQFTPTQARAFELLNVNARL
jgi:hypothetical protein